MFTGLTLGSILLGVALLLIVLMVLARPFLAPPETPEEEHADEIDIVYYRKEAVLRQIRELDDDMESGKIAPELYQRTRPGLVAQAALLMKQLDEMGANQPLPEALPADVDAQIEAAVRKLRTPEEIDAQIEMAVKSMRAGQPAAGQPANGAPATKASANGMRYCPRCGRRAESGDRFCSGCGYDLKQETAAPTAA